MEFWGSATGLTDWVGGSHLQEGRLKVCFKYQGVQTPEPPHGAGRGSLDVECEVQLCSFHRGEFGLLTRMPPGCLLGEVF